MFVSTDYFFNGDQIDEILCIDSFWPKTTVNKQIYDMCINQNYRFVSIADLSDDKPNTAYDDFKNFDIASHPSDQGMIKITERVVKTLGLD